MTPADVIRTLNATASRMCDEAKVKGSHFLKLDNREFSEPTSGGAPLHGFRLKNGNWEHKGPDDTEWSRIEGV